MLATLSITAEATPITFSGSSGSRSASAEFDIVGGNLQLTLTNTSSSDVMVPTDILTAVFFNISGDPTLSRISAELANGSTVLFPPDNYPLGTVNGDGVVGGEWAYKSGLSAPGKGTQGVSSAGFGLFGPSNLFPGTDLQPPTSPDGVQYGITSAGDNPATGNTPVTGTNALIKNSVRFTLGNLPQGFTLGLISNVFFQYGTDLSEPGIVTDVEPVPEPATMLLFGCGLVGVYFLRKRIS